MEVDGGEIRHSSDSPHEMHVDPRTPIVIELCLWRRRRPLAGMGPRERHSPPILQPSSGSRAVRRGARFARAEPPREAPRIFASGDATEASRSDLRDVAFAGERARLC